MDIKVICADCGRHIGTFVRLGKRQDTEVEIHACYHKDTYDHIQEQAERMKELEELLVEYGRHQPGCSAQYDDKKYPCRCGWDRERVILLKGGD